MASSREGCHGCCFNSHRRVRRRIVLVLISAITLLLVHVIFNGSDVGVLKSDFHTKWRENKYQVHQTREQSVPMRNNVYGFKDSRIKSGGKGLDSKFIKISHGNEWDSEVNGNYKTSTEDLITHKKLLEDGNTIKTARWLEVILNASAKGVANGPNTSKTFKLTMNQNGNRSNKNRSIGKSGNKSEPLSVFYLRSYAAKKFPLTHVDLMKMKPPTFLEEYRNPCYTVEQTESKRLPIQCIPYFYLIGAPKSGTTDLFMRLVKHREISEYVVKEPHWLTRKRFFSHNGVVHPMPKWSTYEAIFRPATRQIYSKKDPDGFHPLIVGDFSASTMWDNDYWTHLPEYKNLTEPLFTNADYIHHFNPDAKIIAIVRNPIDRLYSDYLFFKKSKIKGPDTFHKGVLSVLNTTRNCLEKNTLRHCLYKPAANVNEFEVRLRIGVYNVYLKEFFGVFPKQQILVIKMEDYSKHIPAYLDKIFNFLNVARLPSQNLGLISNATKKANTRRTGDQKIGDMLPETRQLLRDFYNIHNDKLGLLLGQQFNYNRDENETPL